MRFLRDLFVFALPVAGALVAMRGDYHSGHQNAVSQLFDQGQPDENNELTPKEGTTE